MHTIVEFEVKIAGHVNSTQTFHKELYNFYKWGGGETKLTVNATFVNLLPNKFKATNLFFFFFLNASLIWFTSESNQKSSDFVFVR